MARNRSLKQKDLKRLSDLEMAHPGSLTEADEKELKKLQDLRRKHG